MADLEIGSQAPDFDLATNNGSRIKLSDFIGRPVVIYFYPKDDTPGCTKEAISFTQLKSEFEKLDAVIIGLSPDTPAKHDKFSAKHNLSLILGSDEDKSTAQAYGIWVEKSMYGKKYMGIERSTFLIGKEGNIAQIWRKVRVPNHAEAVLSAVSELVSA